MSKLFNVIFTWHDEKKTAHTQHIFCTEQHAERLCIELEEKTGWRAHVVEVQQITADELIRTHKVPINTRKLLHCSVDGCPMQARPQTNDEQVQCALHPDAELVD